MCYVVETILAFERIGSHVHRVHEWNLTLRIHAALAIWYDGVLPDDVNAEVGVKSCIGRSFGFSHI